METVRQIKELMYNLMHNLSAVGKAVKKKCIVPDTSSETVSGRLLETNLAIKPSLNKPGLFLNHRQSCRI